MPRSLNAQLIEPGQARDHLDDILIIGVLGTYFTSMSSKQLLSLADHVLDKLEFLLGAQHCDLPAVGSAYGF